MIDKLTLMGGKPIPCPELAANIHQPTLDEISVIGEQAFYEYLGVFTVTRDKTLELMEQNMAKDKFDAVKTQLSFYTDFQIVLEMQREDIQIEIGLQTLLSIMFPKYHNVSFQERLIIISGTEEKLKPIIIDDNKWEIIRDIGKTMFCLDNDGNGNNDFNPASKQAEAIAEKIKRRREKLSSMKRKEGEIVILADYVSSLSTALQIPTQEIMKYTVWILFNQVKRFGLYNDYDISIKSLLAGAKKEDVEIKDWMGSL